ncbi:type IV pilin N-terminal domain-containing protein [Methanoregula boonei]|uniref:type IV pilin N-terminal domain-containing protein n=1 Tax=Methanoregula boonei TaxID=358766 RepID=UPI002FBF0B40
MAVSPVIGVMLMLVVTIIIAAVVSGFAGGLVGGSTQKAPTLSMNVKIINMGSWVGSGFFATVTGVSDPIQTKDLKIVTSWSTTKKYDPGYPSGSVASNTAIGATFTGGNTSVPLTLNANHMAGTGTYNAIAPFGFGAGINGSTTISDVNPTMPTFLQNFGNYSLQSGTNLYAQPSGAVSWAYVGGEAGATSSTNGYGVSSPFAYSSNYFTSSYVDPTQAVLGLGWENLRPGDIVNVRIIHIPSGKAIFDKDVVVTGAA